MDQKRSFRWVFFNLLAPAFIIGGFVYLYVRSAPERAAEEQRQWMEQAQAAENRRVLSKCQDLFDVARLSTTAQWEHWERLNGACISLVLDYRITKPMDICHQMGGVEDLNSCLARFKVDGAIEACRSMIHDPDLAPACENVVNHP
jgi:hypothetical protein